MVPQAQNEGSGKAVKNEEQDTYRNWLICSDSFRLEQMGRWVPHYTLTRQGAKNKRSGVATHHAELKTTFWSENEAESLPPRRDALDRYQLKAGAPIPLDAENLGI